MNVQEILLLDSSADIRVGVAKLQQILSTMRMFRDERDALEVSVAKLIDAQHKLSMVNDTLEAELKELKGDYDVLGGEYDALAKLLRTRVDELAKLQEAYHDLANIKMRVGTIDITLDDL